MMPLVSVSASHRNAKFLSLRQIMVVATGLLCAYRPVTPSGMAFCPLRMMRRRENRDGRCLKALTIPLVWQISEIIWLATSNNPAQRSGCKVS
jgi:hypothetical protein